MPRKSKGTEGSRVRRRLTEDEARAVLAEQAASGQSVWAFAQARGLSSKTLYAWRRRLVEQAAEEGASPEGAGSLSTPGLSSVPLVPVRIRGASESSERAVEAEDVLELVVAPRRRIRISGGFDEGTLVRLLRVLDAEVTC